MNPAGDSDRIAAAAIDHVTTALNEFSQELTDRVRREIPSYAQLPREEHYRTIRETAQTLLASLVSHTEPTADQLRAVQAASRRRAYYGLPVEDVLAAFHVVARALWDELRRIAGPRDAELIELVAPMWLWIQAMSSVVADAYAEQAGAQHGQEVVLRQRLMELLRAGRVTEERTSETARRLGFDPDGEFTAFCGASEAWSQGQLDVLQRATRPLRGVVHCGLHGSLMIVLTQGADSVEVAKRLVTLGGVGTVAGVGLARLGLVGAEASIVDAERTLGVAVRNATGAGPSGVLAFEDVWLSASLLDSGERLMPLFARARQVAADNPSIVEAVLAFARSGFSLSGAAVELQVHANTVGYRLSRWEELTGLDPRSFAGLLRSIVAMGELA